MSAAVSATNSILSSATLSATVSCNQLGGTISGDLAGSFNATISPLGTSIQGYYEFPPSETFPTGDWGSFQIASGSTSSVRLDMKPANGLSPCDPIDVEANHVAGESLPVAVCLTNEDAWFPLAAFHYNVVYDDSIILAGEVLDSGPGLDDNPDANVGVTTFDSPQPWRGLGLYGGCRSVPERRQRLGNRSRAWARLLGRLRVSQWTEHALRRCARCCLLLRRCARHKLARVLQYFVDG